MRNHAKRWLALLLAMNMLLAMTACSNNDEPQTNDQPQQEQQTPQQPVTPQQPTEEDYNGKLISEGMMDIQYAQQFAIEKFKGGYRLVTDNLSGNKILVVPENMKVPTELDSDVQVLQLPVTNAYICGSNVVNMCDAIGAIEKVTLIGADTTWRFDSIKQQLDSGHTKFAGGYTGDPDYEVIGTAGTQIAVWNGYEEEVFDKLKGLGICAIAEENTGEPGLYGRMEWMRCLGVLLGVEEQAEAHYADQMAKIEAIRAEGGTDLVVGMGAVSASSGKCFGRKSGDFQADYIRYAGGIYLLEDFEPGKGGSATLTPEDFYLRYKDCDVLIWSQSLGGGASNDHSSQETMEQLVQVYPSIVDFKAYQNDQIYLQASKYIQTGAGDPACVVNDIHTILTSDDPDVTTDHIVRLPWAADLAAEPQQPEQSQQPAAESYDGKLVSEGMMDIRYAEGFSVEKFKGGYRLVADTLSGKKILVVPEGMSVPADLDANIQVVQLPVTKTYISASGLVSMADAIGAAEKVTLVNMEVHKWYIQSIIDQMNAGQTFYVGATSAPDFEMIASSGIQLAMRMDYDEEVFNKFYAMNIPILAERNTSESSLLGRLEWVKFVGVLLGMEEEAISYFDDQKAQIEAIQAKGATNIVVGIGEFSAKTGKYTSRKSGDFQAGQVKAAGGVYNLEDVEPDSGGVLNMTAEDFYLRFKDCDVLIWRGDADSMESISADYPSIVDFKAYQNERIYIQSDNFVQSSANPACIVRDYHTILTSTDPNVTTDHIIKLPMSAATE